MNMDAKILNKILANQYNSTLKESFTMIKLDLFVGYKGGSIFTNQSIGYNTLIKERI